VEGDAAQIAARCRAIVSEQLPQRATA